MSYHCGSVWPHDTAIVASGLARYGFHKEAARLTTGLVRAASANGGRLPELLCGLSRTDVPRPVPYPTACQPQAWSAASPWLLVRTVLGLDPDIPNGTLRVDPHLPSALRRLRLENVLIAGSRITIGVDHGDVTVDGVPKGITLTT
jgi:glycogen debranching enzyme